MQKGDIGVTTENIFPVIKKFLYSDHEIFLREMVSNAIDATQKLKTLQEKGDFKGEMGDLTVRVALDKDKVTITVTGIGSDEYGEPRLTCTIVNGSDKLLSVGTDEFYVNSYLAWPQAYIPVESSDGWTFYGDETAAPGETEDFYIALSSLANMGIDAIRELEFRFTLTEVEADEEGY